MNKCLIFAGGKPEPKMPDGISAEGAFIIAADRGYKNCKKLKIAPDLYVGDGDSLGFIPNDCEALSYPKEKDDTDLMLAAREALSRGYADITILGALGGRFDHIFGNVQTLAFIRSEGAWGRIVSCHEQIILLTPGTYEFYRKDRFSLSLFSYSERVIGLDVKGCKYPLVNAGIDALFPIGISNEIIAEKAEISFDEGMLLLVQSRV